ncbi:MAG: DUF1345 domain-containing protein [Candidatus Dormibacteria bacterium]
MNARTRLLISVIIGLLAFVPAILFTPWQVAELFGWDVAATFFVSSVFVAARGRTPAQTEAMATREDDSRVAADAILIGASLASLVGVVLALLEAGHQTEPSHSLITALAFLSVVLSWSSVHTVFTLRYARLYYAAGGGIDWHSHDRPDFGDFAYVALTLGMTFQVSDTDINTKPIRKAALRHALLSYLFGVVILATTINVVAGLLAK